MMINRNVLREMTLFAYHTMSDSMSESHSLSDFGREKIQLKCVRKNI